MRNSEYRDGTQMKMSSEMCLDANKDSVDTFQEFKLHQNNSRHMQRDNLINTISSSKETIMIKEKLDKINELQFNSESKKTETAALLNILKTQTLMKGMQSQNKIFTLKRDIDVGTVASTQR